MPRASGSRDRSPTIAFARATPHGDAHGTTDARDTTGERVEPARIHPPIARIGTAQGGYTFGSVRRWTIDDIILIGTPHDDGRIARDERGGGERGGGGGGEC